MDARPLRRYPASKIKSTITEDNPPRYPLSFERPGVYNGARPSARRRSSRLISPQILHFSAARCGAVAHQGERILCKDEVGGSSPPSSTRAVLFDYRGSRVPRAMNPSAVIPREGGNLAVHVRTRGYRDTHTAMKQMEPQGEGVLTALAAPRKSADGAACILKRIAGYAAWTAILPVHSRSTCASVSR